MSTTVMPSLAQIIVMPNKERVNKARGGGRPDEHKQPTGMDVPSFLDMHWTILLQPCPAGFASSAEHTRTPTFDTDFAKWILST